MTVLKTGITFIHFANTGQSKFPVHILRTVKRFALNDVVSRSSFILNCDERLNRFDSQADVTNYTW